MREDRKGLGADSGITIHANKKGWRRPLDFKDNDTKGKKRRHHIAAQGKRENPRPVSVVLGPKVRTLEAGF